jgi:hypothetical protein
MTATEKYKFIVRGKNFAGAVLFIFLTISFCPSKSYSTSKLNVHTQDLDWNFKSPSSEKYVPIKNWRKAGGIRQASRKVRVRATEVEPLRVSEILFTRCISHRKHRDIKASNTSVPGMFWIRKRGPPTGILI